MIENLIQAIQFPLNLLLLLVMMLSIVYLYKFHSSSMIVKAFSSVKMAIILSVCTIAVMIIDGSFALNLYKSPFFILLLILVMISLMFVTLRRLRFKTKRDAIFITAHLGILLSIVGGVWGYPDKNKHKMIVGYESPTNIVYNFDMKEVELNFTAQLESFEVDYWDVESKMAKEFVSEVTFNDGESKETHYIKVNSPINYKGYDIYQDGYDSKNGSNYQYTVLLLVKDPWLPLTYTGLILLFMSGVLMMFFSNKKR